MILQGESGGVGTETIEELPEEENLQKNNNMKIDSQDNSVSSSIEYVKSWKERWLKGSVLAQWYFNKSVLIN